MGTFRADLKLEDLPVEKLSYTFVYRDGDDCVFMDPTTFEQISVPASVAGSYADFFEPDLSVTLEFVDGKPIGALAPDVLEAVIANTAPPIHGSDQVWKPATLANGVSVMVPPSLSPATPSASTSPPAATWTAPSPHDKVDYKHV